MYVLDTPQGRIVHKGRGYVDIDPEKRIDEWVSPLFVQVLLTNRCNLDCPWCYASASRNLNTMFDREFLKEMLAFLDKKIIGVSFGGGEPLTYPHLIEILEFTRKRTELATSITTNGLLLEERMDVLEYLDEVRISVYPQTIDAIMRNMREVSSKSKTNDVNIGINVMLFRNGAKWIEKAVSTFKDYINDVLITMFVPAGRGSDKRHMVPTYKDIVDLIGLISRIGLTVKVTGRLGMILKEMGIILFELGAESTVSIFPDLTVSPSSIERRYRIPISEPNEILQAYRTLLEKGAYR